MTKRKGDWILTHTGKHFYPLDPKQDAICIEDIAYHLANINRYTGAGHQYLSVAQHCVLVSELVPRKYALWGLLHDASEAYMNDLNKAVKSQRELLPYKAIENIVIAAIVKKFGLYPLIEPKAVKKVDKRICINEMRALWPRKHWPDKVKNGTPFAIEVDEWSPSYAEYIFLHRYTELSL